MKNVETENRSNLMKGICPLFLLLLLAACTPVHSRSSGEITLAPAAERTVCIQTDPAVSDMALVVKPLEANLASKGYRLVESPDQAAYTLRLDLVEFGLKGSLPRTYGAPMVIGSGTGAALGGATGGLIGFGVGRLLSGPRSVPFIGKVDVSVTDASKREQKARLTAWARVRKESQEEKAETAVAEKLAAQIAAMMP